MAATAGLSTLGEIRHLVAQALEPDTDNDPAVLTDVVDSLTPPAILLLWDDPWLSAGIDRPTLGPCMWQARLRVLCVAWRLEPGSGYDKLADLVAYVLGRMKADPYPWTLDRVQAPAQFDLAGVTYLASSVIYTTPTTI